MSGCGTRIVLRGQKPPRTLRPLPPASVRCFRHWRRSPFAASSIICAFGLASAAPRSPYRHLELCGIAQKYPRGALRPPTGRAAGSKSACGPFAIRRAAKDAISYIWGLGLLHICTAVRFLHGGGVTNLTIYTNLSHAAKLTPKIIRLTRDRKTGIRYNRGNRKSTLQATARKGTR